MGWFKVDVTFDDDRFQDEIKGENEKEALKNAYDNWENATDIKIEED